MSVQANARPIIIKRKKVVGGGGHHGGAWKVAYADFVTAMMAFFMLMWLLNATTEQQRKGLSDYFSPSIPISRTSGGGDGNFGGSSVFSEETLPQNGIGASAQHTTESQQARGESGMSDEGAGAAQDEVFESLEALLVGHGGESTVMENELRHINTRLTDEGLVIEVFATEDARLFHPGTNTPTALLRSLAGLIADTSRTVSNGIAVEGHVAAEPIVLANNLTWDRSAEQASIMRVMLEESGVSSARIKRVTGHADRQPAAERNPMAIRNNRLEIILLR
ncbi:flagellar motor protein MotB [uncultured Tateyamaria sp.]|uniref:flagellar motor protein MotB n=1 Tax=uncultured Tateyamaria sp. TaxID=455651 RepID=UPI002626023C|nr:flagellar motor protein MotB [uncultured Tateyamaria sp.]